MENLNKFNKAKWLFATQCMYKWRFSGIGEKTIMFSPMRLDETESIRLGKNVFIAHNSWLMGDKTRQCTLFIDDYTVIGHYSHIIAKNSVYIGKSVLIADKVFISDCTHSYKDVTVPVSEQEVVLLKPVSIGEGSWIGENVCILGASIGCHCVVGANSVVTKDIPDYTVVAGNPAKAIKKYDFASSAWKICNGEIN